MSACRIFWVSLLMAAFRVAEASAQLPADQTVQWRFHQTPSNSNSPVDFRIVATLKAIERDRYAIGWEVQSLEFVQILEEGTKTWVENYPDVDTPDGLWWAVHDDPLSPALNEFLSSPLLSGVAAADNPADEDLDYRVASTPSTLGVYANTAQVTYALAPIDPDEPPVKSGDNEPVETDGTRDID